MSRPITSARGGAPRARASVASGRASREVGADGRSKTCASWPASANVARTSSCRYSRSVVAGECRAALLGSRKRRSRSATSSSRRRSVRESQPPAGLEPEVEALTAGSSRRVARGDALQRDGRRDAPGGARALGIADRRLTVDQVERRAVRRRASRQLARGRRQLQHRSNDASARRASSPRGRGRARPSRGPDGTASTPTTVAPSDEDARAPSARPAASASRRRGGEPRSAPRIRSSAPLRAVDHELRRPRTSSTSSAVSAPRARLPRRRAGEAAATAGTTTPPTTRPAGRIAAAAGRSRGGPDAGYPGDERDERRCRRRGGRGSAARRRRRPSAPAGPPDRYLLKLPGASGSMRS